MEASFDDEVQSGSAPVILTSERPHMVNEPDDSLMTFMALKDEDLELAQDACVELHRRHSRLFVDWCMKRRFETFGEAVEDWVNETFARAYDKAHMFTCDSKLPTETKTRLVRGWLFRILENLFLERCRNEAREKRLRDVEFDEAELENLAGAEQDSHADGQPSIPTGRKALIARFIDGLGNDDRKLLLLTGQYYDPQLKRVEIPREIREVIYSELGVTEVSLRVRRKRLLDRLRDFILEKEQERTTKP